MAHLIKPGEIKVDSKDNEILVNISLDLNISLDGTVTGVSGQVQNTQSPTNLGEVKTPQDDNVNWAIPDFESASGKLDFGKEEKE